MAWILDNQVKRHRVGKFAAGLAVVAALMFGTFTISASAQDRGDYRNDDRQSDGRRGHDHRNWDERGNQHGWDHRGDRGHDGWDRRYYHPSPPVVYGSPYYYPPPVVTGPGFILRLP